MTEVLLLFKFLLLINTAKLIYSNNEVCMRAEPHITPNDKSLRPRKLRGNVNKNI